MKRRTFMKVAGAALAARALGPAVAVPDDGRPGDDAKSADKETNMDTKAEELAAYCGRYCGGCGICGFSIGTGLAAVRNVVEAAGFKREAEHLGWPLMRDLATHCCGQFETQVQSFAELALKFFPSDCRGGCVPPCEIAKCCKSKAQTTCADCGDLAACSKVAELVKEYPEVKANLQDIAKQGIKQWAQTQFAPATGAKKRLLTEAIDKAFR
jgi:hypothetical protein